MEKLHPEGKNIGIENRSALSFGWGWLGFNLKEAYMIFLKKWN